MKIFKEDELSQADMERIEREAKILCQFKNNEIIKFEECQIEAHQVFIVMEYAPSILFMSLISQLIDGDMAGVLREKRVKEECIDESIVLSWFKQLINALGLAHNKAILHRDIKPNNIFFGKYHEIKLGDFGISKQFTDSTSITNTMKGTLNYMVQELCFVNSLGS
jgi:serine/threonine protein kinase